MQVCHNHLNLDSLLDRVDDTIDASKQPSLSFFWQITAVRSPELPHQEKGSVIHVLSRVTCQVAGRSVMRKPVEEASSLPAEPSALLGLTLLP